MTTKDLEHYINLVDKALAGFERIGYFFLSYTLGKMLSDSIACHREIIHERKLNDVASFIVVLF